MYPENLDATPFGCISIHGYRSRDRIPSEGRTISWGVEDEIISGGFDICYAPTNPPMTGDCGGTIRLQGSDKNMIDSLSLNSTFGGDSV